jgi:hypothetical protein
LHAHKEPVRAVRRLVNPADARRLGWLVHGRILCRPR